MTQINSANTSPKAANSALIPISLGSRTLGSSWAKTEPASRKDFRLQGLRLAKGLDTRGLSELGKVLKTPKILRKGLHLYRQSDDFRSVYFIRSGCVKAYISNADGDEGAVSFVFPSESLGLDGLYNKQYTSSVVALEDTVLCELPFVALQSLAASQPLLQRNFNELFSRQIIQQQAMTIVRGQKSAADRLVAFLLELSERYAEISLSSSSFRLPMTRKDIACCLGLTIETVSRLFSLFKEQGWLEVNGREVTLTNMPQMSVVN